MAEHEKIGVLLGQIGTPEAPTRKALTSYLKAFLSDPRVIDSNRFLWRLFLHGFVLRTRPARSARMYQEIWTAEGSPLLSQSRKVVRGLQERLGDGYAVELGMAYGGPSIPDAVSSLEAQDVHTLMVQPLFPQFSTAASASLFDDVYAAVSGRGWNSNSIRRKGMPALTFAPSFYNHPAYLRALSARIRQTILTLPQAPDIFILTFHGMPKRYVREGDPYLTQCQNTVDLLAAEMGWKADQYMVTFQSRFGRETWLGPYTDPELRMLHGRGYTRPCVVPLSFVTDCLETLHELGIIGRRSFAEGGGDPDLYTLMPCLNDEPHWLDALATIVRDAYSH